MKQNHNVLTTPGPAYAIETDELDDPFEYISEFIEIKPPKAQQRNVSHAKQAGKSNGPGQRDTTQDLLDMIEPCELEEEDSGYHTGDTSVTDLTCELFSGEKPSPAQEEKKISGAPPVVPPQTESQADQNPGAKEQESESLESRLNQVTEVLDSSLLRFRLAVDNFMKTMREGDQEATCYLIIGCLYVKKGLITDAMGYFRSGLHVPGISNKEATALFFQLGRANEKLENYSEAEYYYSRVHRMNPNYRSVARRLQAVSMFSECTSSTQVSAEAVH